MAVTIEKPIFKPDVNFKPRLQVFEEKVTIVHCTYNFPKIFEPSPIRIWPTTFLEQENGARKKLLQAYNISSFPEWKLVNSGHRFTLIFEGLDKVCKIFHLIEDIPEAGAFKIDNIQRNASDVYWLTIQ